MCFELREVDEKVGFGDGLGSEYVIAQSSLVGVADFDLRYFVEEVALHAGALNHCVETGLGEGSPRGNGDSAALTNGNLG